MNPEEGELRPQLLDRFGLTVEVRAARDVDDPGRGGAPAAGVRGRPGRLRRRLGATPRPTTGRPDRRRPGPARPVVAARRRAAPDRRGVRRVRRRRHARRPRHRPRRAWRTPPGAGRTRSTEEDVRVAARLALPHRRRRDPFDEPGWTSTPSTTPCATPRSPEPRPRRRPDGAGPDDTAPRRPRRRRRQPATARPARPTQTDRPERAARATGRGGTERAAPGGDGDARRPRRRRGPRSARARCGCPGIGEGAPGRRSRARTDAGRVVRAVRRRAAPGRRPAPAGHDRRRRAAPARPRPHRRRAPAAPRRPARAPSARAARATWCCSPSTRPARWPRGPGWPRSAAPCCRCCATPTSAATRSGWSRFRGRRRRAGAAADVQRPGRPGPAGRRCAPAAAPRSPTGCCGPARCCAVERLRDPRRRAAAGAAHRRPGHRRRPAPAATPCTTPAGPPRCWPPTAWPPSWSTARAARSGSAWPPGSPPRRAAPVVGLGRAVRRPRRRRRARRAAAEAGSGSDGARRTARCRRDSHRACRTTG